MNRLKIIAFSFILFPGILFFGILFLGTNVSAQTKVIPGDLRITLVRTMCLGRCPFYRLTIRATGKVIFEPLTYNEKSSKPVAEGPASKGSVAPEKLRAIIAEFEKINFFSLNSRYGNEDHYTPDKNCPDIGTDHPSAITSLTLNGKTKKVNHYHGCYGLKILEDLTELEDKIDEIANTKQWLTKKN